MLPDFWIKEKNISNIKKYPKNKEIALFCDHVVAFDWWQLVSWYPTKHHWKPLFCFFQFFFLFFFFVVFYLLWWLCDALPTWVCVIFCPFEYNKKFWLLLNDTVLHDFQIKRMVMGACLLACVSKTCVMSCHIIGTVEWGAWRLLWKWGLIPSVGDC